MGNVCVGPNLGNGFLQSITSAFKKTPPQEGRLPAPNADNNNKSAENAAPDSSKDSDAPKQVQSTPPELVKIPSDEKLKPPPEPEKPAEPEVHEPTGGTAHAGKAEKPAKPEMVNHPASNNAADAGESEKPVKLEVVNEAASNNTTNAGETTKPTHVKRASSMGLRIESVLGRKTENIKDLYSLGRKLGQGQFGTTYYCLEKATGKEFACKSILKRKLNTQEDVDDVRREIQIMHHLAGHPNVIQIIGAYEDAVAVHVVMELCAGGELFDRIIQRGHYTEKRAAELARVIVGVVEAFHSMGVMHRDLKPENFLFVNQEEEAQLKTIDFGLSVFFRPGESFTDVVGSPYYVAPEVLRKFYGQECDVWSAGVIIYILLSGVPPFWDETELGIFDQVLKGELDLVSEPWPSISASAKDLLRKMLVRDPKKRLSAREVLSHPWFQTEGFALDKPLDSVVLTRLKHFSARNNKLKKMAFRVIAESLSEDEIAGLKEMFKMIDTDNSGHITLDELKVGLERVGAFLKDSEINQLMQSADTDNSGTIDYGEFIAAMLHENKVQQEDRLYTAFSYFDKDGSGYITRDELQQACQQFGLQDVQLDDIIREVDQDNDGRIDYNEFVAMMQDSGLSKKGLQNITE
ncbi:calcium-dependent protein kinase 20-like isoform X2 [Prosopis cineraria]|uniref:calcium-dependent protein kinase 20-like isoform X2 n=1 Tax=Prosopis cineraria TaxID=364024 RepID=UPI0024107602|nr:calcium-dependent protein kinase 20-like isoform X2 [Prosopis cineraria]